MTTHLAFRCSLLALMLAAGAGANQPPLDPGRSIAPSNELKSAEPAPPSPQWSVRAKAFGGHEWVTRPSRDAIMGFALPVEIDEVLVTDGQRVKKGQLLVRGRDAEVLAALATQRIRAANEAEVESAKAGLELAQIRNDAMRDAQARNAASPSDVADRRIALAAAVANKINAEARLAEQRAQVTQLERQAERFRMDAPFDGTIDAVAVEVGQAVDVNRPVLRMVAVDPMWIDVPTPTETTLALGLKADTKAWVLLDLPGEPRVLEAKVLTVSPVADAAAGTRRVRVEMKNPESFPPGIRARVRFTEPEKNWWKPAPTQVDTTAKPLAGGKP